MFGRRTTDEESTTSPELVEKVGGKGRPTPSRKDAEAARKKRMTPPRNRKEAAALQRQRSKEQRVKQRAALAGTGSQANLPARDQGPVKAYVRDYVDSRFTIGQFLLVIFVAMFGLVYVRTSWAASLSSSLFVTVFLLLIVDSVRVSRGVRKGITERFGAAESKGITMYALLRAWQMRRLRIPKPRVSIGDTI